MWKEFVEFEPGLKTRVPVTRLSRFETKCVHGYYTMPVESADGRRIIYFKFDRKNVHRRDPETLSGELMVADADGSNPKPLTRTKGSPAQGATQQWAGTTNRAGMVSGFDERWAIIDVDDGRTWGGDEQMRDISPDGESIFCQTREDVHMRAEDEGTSLAEDDVAAVIMNYQTREISTRISLADVFAVHPEATTARRQHMCFKQTLFSPDGQHLSFVFSNAWYARHRGTEPRRHELFIADRGGTNLRWLGPFTTHPSWHPDSKHLFAITLDDDDVNRFMLYPVDGSDPFPLDVAPPAAGHPVIQPLHHRYLIADMYDEENDAISLKIFDLKRPGDAGETLMVAKYEDHSNDSGTHLHPSWTRDGRSLHFDSAHLGHSQVYRLDLEL